MNIRSYVKALVVCGIALAMVSSVAAQGVKQGKATVVRVKGKAQYSTGNNEWKQLKVNTVLQPGTVIQTAASSTVDIVLGETVVPSAQPVFGNLSYAPEAEENVVRMSQDSVLAIDKLTVSDTGADVVTETQLDLRMGRIFGSVKKLSAGSSYNVKLPNGIAGIRGTIYAISADGVVQVVAGSVVVAWVKPDGTTGTQVVPAGYQYDLRTGELTPLAPPIGDEIMHIIREASIITTSPMLVVTDHTVYFVSPIRAQDSDSSMPELARAGK
jgi:hypothetical protein